jgi:hypothetical protein
VVSVIFLPSASTELNACFKAKKGIFLRARDVLAGVEGGLGWQQASAPVGANAVRLDLVVLADVLDFEQVVAVGGDDVRRRDAQRGKDRPKLALAGELLSIE